MPYFISPMLAVLGSPFDSDDYVYEFKWDGYRAILFCEAGSYRLMSRNSVDLSGHYPELKFLSRLPEGTALDGELVALVEGKPDFESLRSGSRDAKTQIIYFVFDLLYKNFESRMSLPLIERKKQLENLLSPHLREQLAMNQYIETYGKLFFEKVKAQGLEGIIAKDKMSLYIPGKREDTWKKIKRSLEIYCVIIGFTPGDSGTGFKNLILASEINGELKYVGRVGTGFSQRFKEELFRSMQPLIVNTPLVPCPERGVWIKPELFCKIRYAEFTNTGMLRAPVFKSLAA